MNPDHREVTDAGIAAAFAGVSGGFSANFVPSSLDPLLQGLTLQGAQLLDPDIQINVLNNYFFTTASSVLIISLGWFLTDKVVEPKLARDVVDGDLSDWPADLIRYPILFQEAGAPLRSAADFSGSFRVGYDPAENALYIAVEVADGVQIKVRRSAVESVMPKGSLKDL